MTFKYIRNKFMSQESLSCILKIRLELNISLVNKCFFHLIRDSFLKNNAEIKYWLQILIIDRFASSMSSDHSINPAEFTDNIMTYYPFIVLGIYINLKFFYSRLRSRCNAVYHPTVFIYFYCVKSQIESRFGNF